MRENDVSMNEVSRQVIYSCLAKCYQLPEKELLAELETVLQELGRLESAAVPHAEMLLNSFIAHKALKILQVDFSKLFVGPYSLLAPPYGSVYLEDERRIMGESTIDVVHFYRKAGLQLASSHRDAPDHIATELEFMSFLVNEEVNTLASNNDARFLELLDVQKTFLNCHLNLWIKAFTQKVKSGTHSDFFVNLADVTHIFINEDADYLLNLDIRQTNMA